MPNVMPAYEVPAAPVVPYPYGLFSVAPATTPTDGHWQSGVWWRSVGCNQVGVTHGVCTVDSPVPTLAENVACSVVEAAAFTVYARSGESVGGASLTEKMEAARQTLLGGEQYAVEKALWSLLLAATTVAEATAGSVQEGIAMAEALIADNYAGSPILHMSRYTATMAGGEVLSSQGGRLVSLLGSQVVAGGGYDTPPPVVASGPQTVFATGGLVVLRGEPFNLGTTIDRDVNDVVAVVERTYVVGWDCAAVRVAVP